MILVLDVLWHLTLEIILYLLLIALAIVACIDRDLLVISVVGLVTELLDLVVVVQLWTTAHQLFPGIPCVQLLAITVVVVA